MLASIAFCLKKTKLFTIMDNLDTLTVQLKELGLSSEEAHIYVELTQAPSTHLKLAHATGINRTKVYRIISDLEKRGLVSRRSDDRGTFLIVSDPSSLQVQIMNQEENVARQREAYTHALPILTQLQKPESRGCVILTHEGTEGFKQMLWHELKTQHEMVAFGGGTIGELVSDDDRWAERHRKMTVDAGYTIRELLNPNERDKPFTLNERYMKRYTHRFLAPEVLRMESQTTIYNDTVATYNWRNGAKMGFEIISASYAAMMRQMFEHYWDIAHH
jgi:sugar-specific transcriptional regulator TrmB